METNIRNSNKWIWYPYRWYSRLNQYSIRNFIPKTDENTFSVNPNKFCYQVNKWLTSNELTLSDITHLKGLLENVHFYALLPPFLFANIQYRIKKEKFVCPCIESTSILLKLGSLHPCEVSNVGSFCLLERFFHTASLPQRTPDTVCQRKEIYEEDYATPSPSLNSAIEAECGCCASLYGQKVCNYSLK